MRAILLLGWISGALPDYMCGAGKVYVLGYSSPCQPCTAGAFCTIDDALYSVNACPVGTYNPSIASTSISACLSCDVGTYNPSTGQSSCLSCAAGTYNPSNTSKSISACLSCAAGTYNPNQRSNSSSFCLPCPAGTSSIAGSFLCSPCAQNTFSALGSGQCQSCTTNTFSASGSGVCCSLGSWSAPGSTSCAQCPLGTYSSTQGANSESSCTPCDAGTYNPSSGSSLKSACLTCPATTFGPALGLTALASCVLCPPGTFSTSAGSSSCTTCPIGSYCVRGSNSFCPPGTYGTAAGYSSLSNCTLCATGSSNAVAGSTSPSSCSKCDIGSYAPSTGSSSCAICPLGTTTMTTGSVRNSSCVPCGAGTYQDTLGAPCLNCPVNTYSTALGAITVSTCQPCPDNGSTDSSGTPSLSLCKAFQCGPGLQPSILTPLSSRDCTPITCPAPLSLSADGTGCAGCGQSSFGTPPACSPCPVNSTCPGFFTLPLTAPATLATGSSACVAASLLSRTPVIIPNQPTSFTLTNIPPLATICAAGGFAIVVLALLVYAIHSPSSARARLDSVLKTLDSFSMAYMVPAGSPLLNRPTSLGGACSLLSLLAFLTVAAVLVLQYAYANVSVQTALNTLLSDNPFTPSVPWAPPLTSLSPAILSGIQLRLFAQDGMACDSLAAGTGVSGSPSGWIVSPAIPCGDNRTLLVLSCATCSFTATSFVKFYLPYTCQSFFLEAIAVDAQGVVNSVEFPTISSVASTNALLSSLTWTVEVLGTILRDSIKAMVTQGYQLSVSAAGSVVTPVGTSIIPSKALVTVTINLPLQTFYSSIVLLPQQSLVSLVSSIVGLLGIIGLFRVLFLISDVTLSQVAQVSKRKMSVAPLTSGLAPPHEEISIGQTNPLRRGAPLAPAPLNASKASASLPIVTPPWKRYEDGVDVWYFNEETNETSWTPP